MLPRLPRRLVLVLVCAIALGLAAQEPAGTEADARTGFWEAIARLDLADAVERAAGDEELAFVDALVLALEGGSEAAEEALCSLASGGGDRLLRRRAGQTALNLLRIEARWEALADFGERCGLTLPEGAIPPALLRLPTESLVVPDERIVLPLVEPDSRLPLVDVVAVGPSGSETVRALIDTGAGACMLSTTAAERLGVSPLGEEHIAVLGSVGHHLDARPAALPELRLGTLIVRDLPVLVVGTEAVEALVPGVSFVVGWEVLQRFAVEIAGPAGELVLRRSDGPTASGAHDLVLLREPVVRVRSGEEELLFLLDTGATSTDATPDLVRRLGLTDLPRIEDTSAGLGAQRAQSVQVIPSLPLTVGGLTIGLGDVTVWEMPAESGRLLELDGTLGADLGLAARLIIDGPARRVLLHAE